jgi:hypothetical protein
MRIVSKPERKREPKPPRRTAFLPVGTIAENDGHLWRLGVIHLDTFTYQKAWFRTTEGNRDEH